MEFTLAGIMHTVVNKIADTNSDFYNFSNCRKRLCKKTFFSSYINCIKSYPLAQKRHICIYRTQSKPTLAMLLKEFVVSHKNNQKI